MLVDGDKVMQAVVDGWEQLVSHFCVARVFAMPVKLVKPCLV